MAIGQSKLHEMLRRGTLLNDAVAWLDAFHPNTKKQVLEWIQKDQLTRQGVDADGNVLGYYSRLTEIISRGRKQEGDHYTLEDTGDFYKSMFITVLRNAIEIDGDVNKFKNQDWYTSRILGLTDENFTKLIETVKARYIDYARKILFSTGRTAAV
jgi:hypothetical protein